MSRNIFGIDLETIVTSQNQPTFVSEVPKIVASVIEWLDKHNAVNEEGIFRIPGNGITIQEIKKSFDEGKGDLSKFNSSDIHSVAGVLKLYLRELPEPLFIWRYYSTFIKVIRNPDHLQRALHLRMLCYGLPKVNRDLVLSLMGFLNKISLNNRINKMTSQNLATVFAPNILRPQKETLNQIMEDSAYVTGIIKSFVDEIAFISKQANHLSTSTDDIPSVSLPRSPSNYSVSSGGDSSSEEENLYATALYPYQASGQWHLPFKKDDKIVLLDIKSEEGWLKGELNGKIGYFPASYVEIVAIPPPVGTPQTLIPIPDFDSQQDLSTISSPLLSSSSTSSSSSISTDSNISSNNNNSTSPISSTSSSSSITMTTTTTTNNTFQPISVSKSSSFSKSTISTNPTSKSSTNLLISNPPPISSVSKSTTNISSSPDLTKIIGGAPPKLSAPPPLVPPTFSAPPPPLSAPPPLISPSTLTSSSNTAFTAPPTTSTTNGGNSPSGSSLNIGASSGGSRQGSFLQSSVGSNTSPDLSKIMSTTPKLSFSSGIMPPSLGVPPPLLPSKFLSSLSNSGSISPPNNNNNNNNGGSRNGSFLETPPPPPPLSIPPTPLQNIPPPITTPTKTTSSTVRSNSPSLLPIDLANLPPPPFSPCSPEPPQIQSLNINTDLPPPPNFNSDTTTTMSTTDDEDSCNSGSKINIYNLPPPIFNIGDNDYKNFENGELAPMDISFIPLPPPPPAVVPANIPPPPPPPPKKLDRKDSYIHKKKLSQEKENEIKKKRRERAEETLTTEQTYVKQLTVVYDNFIEPYKKTQKCHGLTGEEFMDIFNCLEVILSSHKTNLLKPIEDRMLVWDSKPQMGDIFLNNTSFIKLYKHYVNNYDKSIRTLKQCKEKYDGFKTYMATLDYSEKLSKLSLESFLILPIQRLPRYVMLLQDLLKYTANDHEDFNQLCEALSTIKDLTESINTKKSEEDNNTKIQQVQDQIKDMPPNTMTLRKRFVTEGCLNLKKDKYYVFLFTDAMILTKPGKEKKKFKNIINLSTASLNTTDEQNVLKVISQEGTFKFSTDNPSDREHWIKDIKDAIETARQDLIQSAFGESTTLNEGSKGFNKIQDEKNMLKKQKLAQELALSEEEYVDSLTYIYNVFLQPIKKSIDTPNQLVSYQENLEISSNFETLFSCHKTFLSALKERIAEWDSKPLMSDIFMDKAGFLKLYNYYVQNHTRSLQVLEYCIEKYPLFAIHLKRIESDQNTELKVLLAQPLRRVSKYYLVLREILQYTRPKHDDYDALNRVVANLKDQTDKFNANSTSQMSAEAGSKSPSQKYKTIKLTKNSKQPSQFFV
ncbi:hypothetical protein RB653_005259 [Dictyostelium firmibasis]|uniref:Pleckstrin domain-containing protein n=1 Tax=Dictyostelium firmibasis TaxID=79012 RepID=A0AAN7U949_9MYCE